MFWAPRQQPLRITSRQKGVRSEELSAACADGKGTAHRIMRGGNTLWNILKLQNQKKIFTAGPLLDYYGFLKRLVEAASPIQIYLLQVFSPPRHFLQKNRRAVVDGVAAGPVG